MSRPAVLARRVVVAVVIVIVQAHGRCLIVLSVGIHHIHDVIRAQPPIVHLIVTPSHPVAPSLPAICPSTCLILPPSAPPHVSSSCPFHRVVLLPSAPFIVIVSSYRHLPLDTCRPPAICPSNHVSRCGAVSSVGHLARKQARPLMVRRNARRKQTRSRHVVRSTVRMQRSAQARREQEVRMR